MFDKNAIALPGARGTMVVLALCSLADALLIVGQAWNLASALSFVWALAGSVDGASFAEGTQAALTDVALFAVCYLLRQVVAFGRGRYLDAYAQKRATALRGELADSLYDGGQAFVQRHGQGVTTVALVDGVDQVKTYLALIFPKIVDLMVVPVVLTVALFVLDWVSGIIALVLLPCIIWYMRMLGANAHDAAARQHDEYERLSNHFIDTMRGIPTLKYFGRSRGYGRRVYQVSERFREATVKTLKTATLSSLVLDLFRTFALAAVAIMLGFRLMAGWVALLPALACLIIVPEYFAPVRRYASDFHASLDGANQLASILGMIGTEQGSASDSRRDGCAAEQDAASDSRRDECAAEQDAASDSRRGGCAAEQGSASDSHHGGCAAKQGASEPAIAAWSEASELRLDGLCFSYGSPDEEEATFALEDVSLRIAGFTKVGIVGPSGSGKSTLSQIIAGFYQPASGQIAVDGQPVDSLSTPDWLSQVTYIPQSPHIFSASLRENIAFYCPDAPKEQVVRAAAAVGLDALIDDLPNGLDTPIGQGGRALSGGQSQRVALARALLDERRRIWVLDEPTAHLDIETELELKNQMLPLMEDRLVVFATHRMHWLDDMDQVAVLRHGKVELVGTPEEARLALRHAPGAGDEMRDDSAPCQEPTAELEGGTR